MIIFDTETTGFVKALITPINEQPKIIEFAGIKLDDETLEEVERLEFLVNPQEKLPAKIIEITGIKDTDLKDTKTFEFHYEKLSKFFKGEKYLIAHNVAFDFKMLVIELDRIGKVKDFPFPKIKICTVNKTYNIRNYRLKLHILYEHLFGEEFKDAHRAMADTEALVRIVKELIKKEFIKL